MEKEFFILNGDKIIEKQIGDDSQKYSQDALKISGVIWEECYNYPEAEVLVKNVDTKLRKLYLFRDLFKLNLVTTISHNKERGDINVRFYYSSSGDNKIYDKNDVINMFIHAGIYPGNFGDTLNKLASSIEIYTNAVIDAYNHNNSVNENFRRIMENMEVDEDFSEDDTDTGGEMF